MIVKVMDVMQKVYARCGTIEDASIDSVDVYRLGAEIYNLYFDNDSLGAKRDNKIRNLLYGSNKEFDLYTIDRILRKLKSGKMINGIQELMVVIMVMRQITFT